MWTYNGKRIREGRAWTDDNGVQHPANWAIWSEDEKVAHGLVWVAPQTKPDERFYWFSQNADGTYTTTPKALEDIPTVDEHNVPVIDPDTMVQLSTPGLKSNWTTQTKQTQGRFCLRLTGRIFVSRILASTFQRTFSSTATKSVWRLV